MAKSRGQCERCHETAVCNDMPSSKLPPRIQQVSQETARKMGIVGRLFATRKEIDEGMQVERVKSERDKFVVMSVIKGILKKKKKEGLIENVTQD